MANVSFPRERVRILLLENIHPGAQAALEAAGYPNVTRLEKALPPEELTQALAETHLVGIRSKTKLPAALLAKAPKLLGIGAFCIGTDQVDLDAAAGQGIAVFNSPHSSTRSVAELTLGSLIHLLRRIPEKAAAAALGEWKKTHKGAVEIRGKTLGIIGYGRIGAQVSVLAEAMGMKVLFYDTQPVLALGNAQACKSMAEVLRQSDAVTLHVPKAASTKHLIGKAELAQMKPGAVLINYARGEVIVAEAVAEALRSGQLSGAAVDVFEKEPRKAGDHFETPLQGFPNVILTPHIGGSTEEAQANIGQDVAQKLLWFLETGQTLGSVTLPELNLPRQAGTHRVLHLHENRPGVLAEINRGFSELGLNINAQYLKTNERVGYVVTDLDPGEAGPALDFLNTVPGTLRTRSLF